MIFFGFHFRHLSTDLPSLPDHTLLWRAPPLHGFCTRTIKVASRDAVTSGRRIHSVIASDCSIRRLLGINTLKSKSQATL